MKTNNSSGPGASQTQSQPPWAKTNLTVNTSETASTPPWANKTGTPTNAVSTPKNTNVPNTNTTVDSTPPWAKKGNTPATENTSSPPPWANKGGSPANPPSGTNTPTTANQPAWMKNNANSTVVQGNDWKLKQAADIEKQKKEL